MFVVVIASAAGLAIGFAAALIGRTSPSEVLRRVRHIRIRQWPFLALAAALGLAVSLDTNMLAGRFALGIALALLLAGCLLNPHIAGTRIAAAGLAANLLVLLVNGYLPVSEGAVVAAGIVDAAGLDRVMLGTARRWTDTSTIVPWLGGAVPVGLLRDVITVGDLVIAAGLANVGFRLMFPTKAQLAAAERVLAAVEEPDAAAEAEPSPFADWAPTRTTLEHPPLIGAPAPTINTGAPAPTIDTSVPAWTSRVEPAPWPAPSPVLGDPVSAEASDEH